MDWQKKEYWLVFSLIGLTTLYSYVLRFQQVETDGIVDFSRIPHEVGNWAGEDFFFAEGVLDVLKADNTTFRRYVNSHGNEIWLFIGYWKSQKYGAQPHSPLHCLPGSGWNVINKELMTLDGQTNGKAISREAEVNFASISNGKSNEAMLYWYQTRSGIVSKELSVKMNLAKNALLRNPTDAAFIRLTAAQIDQSQAKTLHLMQDFWHSMSQHVAASLPF